MRLTRLDLALLALPGLLVTFGVIHAVDATGDGLAGPPPRAPRILGAGHIGTGWAGQDPLRPPGLPEGVSVDPESGLLVGLEQVLGEEVPHLSFGRLAALDLRYDDPPAWLTALEGQRVAMVGFALSFSELGPMREFLLLGSHFACCYGLIPGPEGIVEVHIETGGAPLTPTYAPVLVAGTLRLVSLYDREVPGQPTRRLQILHLEDASARPLLEAD